MQRVLITLCIFLSANALKLLMLLICSYFSWVRSPFLLSKSSPGSIHTNSLAISWQLHMFLHQSLWICCSEWMSLNVTLTQRLPCRETAYCILSAALCTASSFRIWNSSTRILSLPGASVRHSAHGKGHEEGGSAYTKAGSSLRSPPGNSRASTPKTRVCLLSALCFHLHLWLYGGLSPTTSLWKKS